MSLDVSIQLPGLAEPLIVPRAQEGGDSTSVIAYNVGIARSLMALKDYLIRIDKQTEAVDINTTKLDSLNKLSEDMSSWSNTSWTPPLGGLLELDPKIAQMVKAGLTNN